MTTSSKSEEWRRLLDEPIYGWQISGLLASLLDFLKFSEENIAWQREREVRLAREQAEALHFSPEDEHLLAQARDQIIEGAELRFDVGLAQNVRYASVVAYIGAFEWCMRSFTHSLPPRHGQTKPIHLLKYVDGKHGGHLKAKIQLQEHLYEVRHCIAHASGLIKSFKTEKKVIQAIESLPGFSISDFPIYGPMVHIEAGAVDEIARDASVWLPRLEQECWETGLFQQQAAQSNAD